MKILAMLIVGGGLLSPVLAQTPSSPTPPARLEMRDVTPFPDVPPGHWAASSVETLHRTGIVRGYPAAAKPIRQIRPQTARRQARATVKR